jgi:beta-lactamase regulating signal transducer with metallopeptidase domain
MLASLAGSAGVRALGWALLHSSWQGAAVACGLWLALASLPRSRSSARYVACTLALGALIVAPVVTFAARWLAETAPSLGTASALAANKPEWLLLALSGAWALGCSAMILRLTLGFSHLRRLVRRAEALTEPWLTQLEQLRERVGVRQRVMLLGSNEIDAPLMLGWVRPVILMPIAALSSLPAAYLEALIVHELGHIRRRDFLVNAVQACVEAVLFYHPGARWVSSRMRIEREFCCDDLAIRVTGERLDYARALAAMEAWRAPASDLVLASNGGSLVARIERIVQPRGPGRVAPRSFWAAASVLGCTLALSVAGAWACGGPDEPAPTEPRLATQRTVSDELPTTEMTDTAAPAAPELGIPWLPPSLKRWEPEFAAVAARHGIHPALVAIITLIESAGNPAARSPGGAIGLMQLMPTTAADIAAQRAIGGHSEARLWEPAYNIDFGAWYLAQQLATFGEGMTESAIGLAAVAYNAGPHWTHRYLAGTAELPDAALRYRDLAVGLWNERAQQHSPTYAAWRSSIGGSSSAQGAEPAPR